MIVRLNFHWCISWSKRTIGSEILFFLFRWRIKMHSWYICIEECRQELNGCDHSRVRFSLPGLIWPFCPTCIVCWKVHVQYFANRSILSSIGRNFSQCTAAVPSAFPPWTLPPFNAGKSAINGINWFICDSRFVDWPSPPFPVPVKPEKLPPLSVMPLPLKTCSTAPRRNVNMGFSSWSWLIVVVGAPLLESCWWPRWLLAGRSGWTGVSFPSWCFDCKFFKKRIWNKSKFRHFCSESKCVLLALGVVWDCPSFTLTLGQINVHM